MELPAVFKSDIQTNIINIFPTVVIDDTIFLSTKNHSKAIGYLSFPSVYYKPILLSVPRIKESIDFESRKFKISNVTLKISNYEINGERFTDILKNKSYLGAETIIRWETVGAKTEQDRLEIFKGTIKRITHDNKTASVQLEDLTQVLFHKELPKNRTSSALSLPPKKRNKPIPMTYGHLAKAPTVLDINNTIKADSEAVTIVGKRGSANNWNFEDDVESYYEEHPFWGDFLQQQGSLNNQGVPALTMVIDDYEVYVPEETTKGVGFSNSGIYTQDETMQWEDGGDVAGQIRINPYKASISEDNTTKYLIQVINAMKSPSVKLHFRLLWDDTDGDPTEDSISNDSGYGWRPKNEFRDFVSQKLSDGSYDYNSLDYLNSYDPSRYWTQNENDGITYHNLSKHWDVNGDEYSGLRLSEANQTLMRVSIDSEPPFEYFRIYKMVQFAINGFDFPRMSSHGSDSTHSLYITSRLRTGDWDDGGGSTQGIWKQARYPHAGTASLSTKLDNSDDNAPFEVIVPEAGRPDWKFKYLFGFTDVEDDDNYSGLVDGEEGYENLIRVYDLECKTVSAPLNDYDPTVHSWYIQVTQSTAALGQINLSWGAYIGGLQVNDYGFEHSVRWKMALGGNWSEVDILQLLDIENPIQKDYYLNVLGRQDEDGLITNPIAIMRDIAINELGLDEDMIDEDSYNHARVQNYFIAFAFSVNEVKKSKDLLEDMAKSTLCYPYFKNNGKLAFPSLQVRYSYDASNIDNEFGYLDAINIKAKDVINFSFNKTKLEQVYTGIEFNYNYSYVSEEYRDKKDGIQLTNSELNYNGYKSIDDNILTFESPYITNGDVADSFMRTLFRYYKNAHLELKIKLPLNYISLEVGSLIKFEELINGVLAYGIDYTKVTRPKIDGGGQWLYPIFFVSSVTKNLNSIEIVAQQVHQLWKDWEGELWDYDSWLSAGLVEGFTLSEEEEVIPDEEVEEEVFPPSGEEEAPIEQDPVNTIEMIVDTSISGGAFQYYEFAFTEELIGSQIAHYFTPSAWGLNSFQDIIPNHFHDESSTFRKEYVFLEFKLNPKVTQSYANTEFPYPLVFRLMYEEEDLGHGDKEFRWVQLDEFGEQFHIVDRWDIDFEYNQFGIGQGTVLAIGGTAVPFVDLQFKLETHYIAYSWDFLNSFGNNQLELFNPDIGGLTFNSQVPLLYPYQSPYVGTGDANFDGVINILDIVALVNYILGTGYLSEQGEIQADVNQDGTINILDILEVVNMLLGTEL
tara:strand:- start:2556 stop:6302 length:3747 start_codon:yes stop_codon:yes gene_type:complete